MPSADLRPSRVVRLVAVIVLVATFSLLAELVPEVQRAALSRRRLVLAGQRELAEPLLLPLVLVVQLLDFLVT